MADILVVDDEKNICELLTSAVEEAGHTARCAQTLKQGQQLTTEHDFAAVLLDVHLPDGNGLENLSAFLHQPSRPEVIIITGYADLQGAEYALTQGAFDYIQKPVTLKEVELTLSRALEYRDARLVREKGPQTKRDEILGNSQPMRKVIQSLSEGALGEHSILITGETGTGKELFARAVHSNSRRWEQSFITVDCAVLTENLVESTLFGHVKGSFTGAVQNNEGLIALADGGTLFLDEIGELPLSVQKRLLRVIEDKSFRPVGSQKTRTSHFRLVAATNKDLDAMVEKGEFRQDLLFRIRSQEIHLPPLRGHREDIPDLVSHYVRRICQRMQVDAKQFHQDFLDYLYQYDWPGNVRELVNTLDQVISRALHEPALHRKHLPVNIRVALLEKNLKQADGDRDLLSQAASPLRFQPLPDWKTFKQFIHQEAEELYFRELHAHFQGDVSALSEWSGLTKSRIYSILSKYNISKCES
jgi:two-component system NtrC family response regulator